MRPSRMVGDEPTYDFIAIVRFPAVNRQRAQILASKMFDPFELLLVQSYVSYKISQEELETAQRDRRRKEAEEDDGA